MFEEELESLLEKKWDQDQKDLIKRLCDNVIYYKKLLPKSLKQDVLSALEMCNILKTELEIYKQYCNCQFKKEEEEKNIEDEETKNESEETKNESEVNE
jgi:hypothetical protein